MEHYGERIRCFTPAPFFHLPGSILYIVTPKELRQMVLVATVAVAVAIAVVVTGVLVDVDYANVKC